LIPIRKLEAELTEVGSRTHRLHHVECHPVRARGHGPGVASERPPLHVAITDRLDLLQSVLLGEPVEVREESIEVADHLGRRKPVDHGVKSTTSAKRIEADANDPRSAGSGP